MRATEAYRTAERLGRSTRRSSEWQRLCAADRTRNSLKPFGDFARDQDETDDTDFYSVSGPNTHEHHVRMAYLLGAVAAGTACLFLGGFIAFL